VIGISEDRQLEFGGVEELRYAMSGPADMYRGGYICFEIHICGLEHNSYVFHVNALLAAAGFDAYIACFGW